MSIAPTNENFAGSLKATSVKQLGQSSGRRRSALTPQCREGSEDSLALIEVDVCDLAAVATVPAKGGATEPIGGFRAQEENELEGFGQSDVLQFCCRREGFSEVVAVEGASEAAVGMALGGHEHMFAYDEKSS